MPRRLLTLLAVLSVLALTPAAADEEAAPGLNDFAATADATGLRVSGSALFTAAPTVIGEDPAGDATVPQAGLDLTGAAIEQVSNALLRFRIDVADQIPAVSTLPQVVYYNWNIAVQTGSSTSAFNLQAIRADMYSVATAGATVGEPVFRLQTCVPNEQTGGQSCSVAATLTGEFGDGFVAIDVPANVIGAKASSVVHTTTNGINTNPGAGAAWFNGDGYGDFMIAESYALNRTVTLGVAPAGTAVEDVPLTTAATTTAAGKFQQALEGAAGSVVAAEVCAAGVCTLHATTAS